MTPAPTTPSSSPRPLDRIALISDVHGNLDRARGGARGHRRPRHRPDLQPRRLRRQGSARSRGGRPVPGTLRGQHPRQLGRLPARPRPRARQRGARAGGSPSSPRARASGCAAFRSATTSRCQRAADPAVPRVETTVHRRVRFDHDGTSSPAMFTNTAATGDGPLPDVVGYGDTHDPFYEVDLRRSAHTCSTPAASATAWTTRRRSTASSKASSDSATEAPFSIQFVRVPYDVEAELAVGRRTRDARTRGLHGRRSATASTAATSSPASPRPTTVALPPEPFRGEVPDGGGSAVLRSRRTHPPLAERAHRRTSR